MFIGSQYQLFTDVYTQMKAENYDFPLYKESEALFKMENSAPEQRGYRECFCCQQVFTTIVLKVDGNFGVLLRVDIGLFLASLPRMWKSFL